MYVLFCAGGVVTLSFLLAFKYFERSWAPPAIFFVFGFLSSNYFYPYSIISLDNESIVFDNYNFEAALAYATYSFVALLIGYSSYFLIGKRYAKYRRLSTGYVSENTLSALIFLLALFLIITLASHPFLSSSGAMRGENAYLSNDHVDIFYRIRFIVSQTLIPLIVSIYIASLTLASKGARRARRIAIAAVLCVVISSLLSFDRHFAVSAIFMILLVYHYRVKKISIFSGFSIVAILLSLQFVRLLRNFNIPYADISISHFFSIFDEIELLPIVIGPLTAIAGFDVFTNVLDIVPARDDFKYGATYLSSMMGLFTPRALGLGSYDEITPSRWYVEMYAPGTTSHGFDFSMLAEAYINFSDFMPLAFIVVGLMLAWLSVNIRQTSSPFILFLSVVSMEVLTFSLRMDSNALLKGLTYKALPIILLIMLMNRFFKSGFLVMNRKAQR